MIIILRGYSMKRDLKILVIILVGLFFSSVTFPTFADSKVSDAKATSRLDLTVKPFSSSQIGVSVLEMPFYPDDPFYLFLPADAERNALVFSFPYKKLLIDGNVIKNGRRDSILSTDGKHIVKADNDEFSLNVISSETLPSIHITTESGSLSSIHSDKEHKEKGAFSLIENGNPIIADAELEHIKGRGNSSWKSNEKRCYNIKFSEKRSVLGMKEAKRWALISNNMDATLMRNAIAYSAAQLTDLPYTVDFRFVDLYINGQYRGNYMLCEKVEIGENRIEINDLEKANKSANKGRRLADFETIIDESKGVKKAFSDISADPENISGGYLLEFEYPEALEGKTNGFITKSGSALLIHSPKHATKAETEYVSGLYYELEEALLSKKGTNKSGKHFSELLDLDSFIDGILLYEFADNSDRGLTSFYIFLPENEQKFYMAPIWDFDQTMTYSEADLSCVKALAGVKEDSFSSFISLLTSHRDFTDKMSERLNELAPVLEEKSEIIIKTLSKSIRRSAEADKIRWKYEIGMQSDLELSDYPQKRIQYMKYVFENIDELVREAKSSRSGRNTVLYIAISAVCFAVAASAVTVLMIKKKKGN